MKKPQARNSLKTEIGWFLDEGFTVAFVPGRNSDLIDIVRRKLLLRPGACRWQHLAHLRRKLVETGGGAAAIESFREVP